MHRKIGVERCRQRVREGEDQRSVIFGRGSKSAISRS
jgi:hypothetical protein